MNLQEADRMILQREIKPAKYESEKFNDNGESALTKILWKSQQAALAAFQLVKTAGGNFRLNKWERLPL